MKKTAKKRDRKFSFIICFSIIACICYLIIMWTHLNLDIKDKRSELEKLEKQCSQQAEENSQLSKEISSGISEKELEKLARDKYGYVKPGEHVYADASAGK